MKKKKLILHIINSLGMGGTEKNLFQIIQKTNHKYNHIHIDIPPYTEDGQICEKDARRLKRCDRTR